LTKTLIGELTLNRKLTFGGTHQIVAEYRDNGPGSSALKQLLVSAAQGKFDVLLCTDLTRLTRRLSPEIMKAHREAGVRVVTVDGGEIGMAEEAMNRQHNGE
jgi:DNA invertase Pin-like site-specific DNA recombinase